MILFVAADPRECEPWVSHWSNVRTMQLPVHWARQGTWQGHEMIAIANGAGWHRAAAAVMTVIHPAAIYNIGFCGALDPTLNIGDIFTATQVLSEGHQYKVKTPALAAAVSEPRVSTSGPSMPPDRPPSGIISKTTTSGPLASINRIAQTAAEKTNLRESGALVVEMEAAGVARASEELGVPFYCVRAVSDIASEDFANDFNKYLMPDGRFDVPRLIIGACGSPIARFGELLRLSRRTALASKNLGDFLANCSY